MAHAAVYEALRAAVPEARVVPAEAGGGTDGKGGGEFLLGWIVDEDEDDEDGRWDAVDGGTTATVAVVLRGTTLVLGCVGDSSAALLARDDDSGAATHELLMEEHGPTHLAEYARLREVAAAEDMQWVYDCPGGEQVPIFRDGADGKGEPELDPDAVRRADALECAVKNARGDLFSVVVVPERSVALPPPPRAVRRGTTHEHTEAAVCSLDEQNITMTRSIGDFYAHRHGVSCAPEIREIDLGTIARRGWTRPHLLLASDGVWDLWGFDELADRLVMPRRFERGRRSHCCCHTQRAHRSSSDASLLRLYRWRRRTRATLSRRARRGSARTPAPKAATTSRRKPTT